MLFVGDSIKVDVNASGKPAFTAKGWGENPSYPLLQYNPSTQRLDSAGLAFPGVFVTGGYYLPLRAVAADVDGDGRAEIVHRPHTGDHAEEWHIHWNRGGLSPHSQVIEGAAAPCATSARVLDKTGDGLGDVLFGCASMQLLTTTDAGALVVESAEDLYDNTDDLFIDMNADGLDDLVYPLFDDGSTGVSWNTGRGFGPVETVPNGPLPDAYQNTDEGVRMADFNGDGRADFVVFRDYPTREIEVSLSTARGGYQPTITLPFDSGVLFTNGEMPWGASRVGDFNGDGQTDLVHVNSTTYDWEVLLNRGVDTDRVVAVRDESAEVGGRMNENGAPIVSLPLGISDVRTGFTGHEHDDELGWINMQGRVYDPSLRRFLTSDPVIPSPLTVQGYNPYAYVLNDPLNLRDPTGFEPCDGNHCTPATPVTMAPTPGVTIDRDGTGTKEVNVFEDGAELLPEDDGSIEGSGGAGGADPGGGRGGGEGGPSSEADVGETGINIVGPTSDMDVRQLTHVCLDACGFAPPPIGPTCDVVNACVYWGEGDAGNASLSLMAATPGVGDAGKLYSSVKGAGQVGKAGRMAREAAAPRPARGAPRSGPSGSPATSTPARTVARESHHRFRSSLVARS
ncbi:FG-GAP-like repeat-containing protein [Sorangium sp. So ce1335]|uniref:FG-GAP-like repeat-containing protein n=1 Tax=Sorangium sp. So ce1335 TaxID=3133335 RepID=UPI003F609745